MHVVRRHLDVVVEVVEICTAVVVVVVFGIFWIEFIIMSNIEILDFSPR